MTMYLTTDDVQMLNEGFVGADMLRDFGLLDSAVSRPQASAFGEDAYPSIHEKAATLLYGLTRNHPFIDGNSTLLGRRPRSFTRSTATWCRRMTRPSSP